MSPTMTRSINQQATARTRARYSRIAAFYDRLETLAEIGFRPMRERLWMAIERRLPFDAHVLEVGLGRVVRPVNIHEMQVQQKRLPHRP